MHSAHGVTLRARGTARPGRVANVPTGWTDRRGPDIITSTASREGATVIESRTE
jgi:hypothetical protein